MTAAQDATPPRFDFAARVRSAPEAPGVYIMRDREGRIIYVGKSVNLRSRLRAYANQTDGRGFVKRLPLLLGEIETIIAPTEKDALQLECALINEHRPKFNVVIPGEGGYAWLRLDERAPVPRVEVIRGDITQDGARYFGPYRSAFAVRRLKEVLDRHFLLRTCSDAELANRKRPCLQYQIKRCSGPCVFPLEQIQYHEHVENAATFLAGERSRLQARLTERMWSAAEALDFEIAARCRDQLAAIEIAEVRRDAPVGALDVDVFGHHRDEDALVIQLLFVRRGRLKGSKHFRFDEQLFDDSEVYASFINLYYNAGADVPDELLLPVEIEGVQGLVDLLSELRAAPVAITSGAEPESPRALLLQSAAQNAAHTFREATSAEAHRLAVLTRLQSKLRLKNLPRRMECFDISNFQGDPIVGSMVVFLDGEAAPKDYRTYRVKDTDTQDDFASMYEVLTRRLRRTLTGQWPKPDLIVVDGGPGQLAQAVKVVEELGIEGVDLIALAKSRALPGASETTERSPERVFLPGRKNPIILKQDAAPLLLLARMRDEAHRVAITFHRKLRGRKALRSSLAEIPGVGLKRQKALLAHFGSVAAIRGASFDQLLAVEGVNRRVAAAVRAFFHGDDALPLANPHSPDEPAPCTTSSPGDTSSSS